MNAARLMQWREPPLRQVFTAQDTMRYALGLGIGSDPLDAKALRFVYENGLQALPTMATVLASPFGWLYRTDAGITASHCVHAQQGLRMHRPLPIEGDVAGELAVTGIADKGTDKGAIVFFERRLRDAASGALLCTLTAGMFCRADGGCGSAGQDAPAAPPSLPERACDLAFDSPTFAQQALLFRLSGDFNAIHADPAAARTAGFERPLLHGLATYGAVAYALIRALADGDAHRLVAIDARFSRPVFPGEVIRTEMWCEPGGRVHFRASVPARAVVVLDQGLAEFARGS